MGNGLILPTALKGVEDWAVVGCDTPKANPDKDEVVDG